MIDQRIIIPGISRSGTSYLTKKIHDVGSPMWAMNHDKHYECNTTLFLSIIFGMYYGGDMWYLDYAPNEIIRNNVIYYMKKRKELGGAGFKNPRLIFFMDELLKIFSNAKFIICKRNYHDWRESHRHRGRDSTWNITLKNHFEYIIKIIRKFKDYENIFIFDYDKGIDQQNSLNKFLNLDLDLSDFKIKTYQ